jgi:hypothetical protein
VTARTADAQGSRLALAPLLTRLSSFRSYELPHSSVNRFKSQSRFVRGIGTSVPSLPVHACLCA